VSYGYYRIGSVSDPVRARLLYAQAMANDALRAGGGLAALGEPIPEPVPVRASPAAPADMSLGPTKQARFEARQQGYTGDQCDNCSGVRMKVSGHCTVCEDCGTTTGCS